LKPAKSLCPFLEVNEEQAEDENRVSIIGLLKNSNFCMGCHYLQRMRKLSFFRMKRHQVVVASRR
jgi:hypothetical protein